MSAANRKPPNDSTDVPCERQIYTIILQQYGGEVELCHIIHLFPGMTLNEILFWFAKRQPDYQVHVGNNERGELIKIHCSGLKLCPFYNYNKKITHRCRSKNCTCIHLCQKYFNADCPPANQCHMEHSLTEGRNWNILFKNGLFEKKLADCTLSEDQALAILKNSCPQICLYYNANGCKLGTQCLNFHICFNFIRDSCTQPCHKNHTFTDTHTRSLLDQFSIHQIDSKQMKHEDRTRKFKRHFLWFATLPEPQIESAHAPIATFPTATFCFEIYTTLLREHGGYALLQNIRHLFPDHMTIADIGLWLMHANSTYRVYNTDDERGAYVKIQIPFKMCNKYGNRLRCDYDCQHFHLCRNYLNLNCSLGQKCDFSHSLLTGHNGELLVTIGKMPFLVNLSEIDALTIIRSSSPQLCYAYNEYGSDSHCEYGNDCINFHVCERFIKGEHCGKNCGRSHDFTDGFTISHLQFYGLKPDMDDTFLKKCFLDITEPVLQIGSHYRRDVKEYIPRYDSPMVDGLSIYDTILKKYRGCAKLSQLRELFPVEMSLTDILQWVRSRKNEFRVPNACEMNEEYVQIYCRNLLLCPDYLRGTCSGEACESLHLCRLILSSHCDGAKCGYVHTLKNDHNKSVLAKCSLFHQFGILDTFTKGDTFVVIRNSFPQLCREYSQGNCTLRVMRQPCKYMHVCSKFVFGIPCHKSKCGLAHQVKSKANKDIWAVFNMEAEEYFDLGGSHSRMPSGLEQCILWTKNKGERKWDPSVQIHQDFLKTIKKSGCSSCSTSGVSRCSSPPTECVSKCSSRQTNEISRVSGRPSNDVSGFSDRPAKDVSGFSDGPANDVSRFSDRPANDVPRFSHRPANDVSKCSTKNSNDVRCSLRLTNFASMSSSVSTTSVPMPSGGPTNGMLRCSSRPRYPYPPVSDVSGCSDGDNDREEQHGIPEIRCNMAAANNKPPDCSTDPPCEKNVYTILLQYYGGQVEMCHVLHLFPGMTINEILFWFAKKQSNYQVYGGNDERGELIKIHCSGLKLCPYYNYSRGKTRGCRSTDCENIHLCAKYFNSICSPETQCYLEHSLTTGQNGRLLSQNGLFEKKVGSYPLSEDEALTIFKNSCPRVCQYYNDSGCTIGDSCLNFHICLDFIRNETCPQSCEKNHGFTDLHTRSLLDRFAINTTGIKHKKLKQKFLRFTTNQIQYIGGVHAAITTSQSATFREEIFTTLLRQYNGHVPIQTIQHLFPEQMNCLDVELWLMNASSTYRIYGSNSERGAHVKIHMPFRMCLRYQNKLLCENDCQHLHLCKNYLNLKCELGPKCEFNHMLLSGHNRELLASKGDVPFLDALCENDALTIIRNSCPQLCPAHNNGGCELGDACNNFHICQRFIKPDNGKRCKKKCKMIHDFNDSSTVFHLRMFGLKPDLSIHFLKSCFLDITKPIGLKYQPDVRISIPQNNIPLNSEPDIRGFIPQKNIPVVDGLSIYNAIMKRYGGDAKLSELEYLFPIEMRLRDKSQWFRERENEFIVNDEHTTSEEVIQIYCRNLYICPYYLKTGKCDNKDCTFLHLCRMFLSSHCNGSKCGFEHTILNTHNQRIFAKLPCLNQFGVLNTFSEEELFIVVRNSFPRVCQFYNNGYCSKQQCSYLHLCKNVVFEMPCYKKCPLAHDFKSEQNKKILALHHMNAAEHFDVRDCIGGRPNKMNLGYVLKIQCILWMRTEGEPLWDPFVSYHQPLADQFAIYSSATNDLSGCFGGFYDRKPKNSVDHKEFHTTKRCDRCHLDESRGKKSPCTYHPETLDDLDVWTCCGRMLMRKKGTPHPKAIEMANSLNGCKEGAHYWIEVEVPRRSKSSLKYAEIQLEGTHKSKDNNSTNLVVPRDKENSKGKKHKKSGKTKNKQITFNEELGIYM